VKQIALLIIICLSLAACGGSSSKPNSKAKNGDSGNETSDANAPNSEIKVGVFIDAPVKGLSYKSSLSGLEGITNANGEFKYVEGDSVILSLYNIPLGKGIPGNDGILKVTQMSQALSIAQLLQSLDTDADSNKIDVSDITIPESVEKAIIDNLNDEIGDATTTNIMTKEQFETVKQANEGNVTLQQRTDVVSKETAIEHIKQQIGESDLTFTASELEDKVYFDSSLLTQFTGEIYLFPKNVASSKYISVTKNEVNSSPIDWEIGNQGNLKVTFDLIIQDTILTVNCDLAKIAEDDDAFDASIACPILINNSVNQSVGSLSKPQPFSANDISGKTFKIVSADKSKNFTLTYGNDGTVDCGVEKPCAYRDHESYKNAVWIEGAEENEGVLIVLAQGTLSQGKLLNIFYDTNNKIDFIELWSISGDTMKEEFTKGIIEAITPPDSGDDLNTIDDGSSIVDEAIFTKELIAGKTFYSVMLAVNEKIVQTITFDSADAVKIQDGLHDSVSSPDVTLNYSIDSTGDLIFSNQINDDEVVISFLNKTDKVVRVCVSIEGDGCFEEDWYFNKADAEAADLDDSNP
jgi:hypothetical protein